MMIFIVNMRYITNTFVFITLFLLFPISTLAIYDPLSVPNNRYGIHVVDENDLESAAALVNSSGGEWGYVTMVIPDNERKIDKWNAAFEKMSFLHLIPIIRLATHLENGVWLKPKIEDVDSWVDFLSSLNWPVKNRYLVIFNEPNHANEWGGEINPREYAEMLLSFSKKLKEKSGDFFILPAGLDASAKNTGKTMDEINYLQLMKDQQSEIFNIIDGWTSHAYPNPGFVGSIKDSGRGTLKTYLWETKILKSLGINRDLPIFITETGWPHREGVEDKSDFYTSDQIADFISHALTYIWTEKNIVAITPFILNYQSIPFSNFSWQKHNENKFYPQYDTYRSILKVAGEPVLVNNQKQQSTVTPSFDPTNSDVLGEASKNQNEAKKPPLSITSIINKIKIFFKSLFKV